ncbi:MAG: tetratricopeptide repeat protein [Thermodesulfobacteriota bacterium]
MSKKDKKTKATKKQTTSTEEHSQLGRTLGRVEGLVNHRAFALVFLFLISFAVFLPSLKNGFVWDDVEAIQENYNAFRTLNITSLVIPKDKKHKRVGYYRPVVFSTMFVDKSIWGESPFGFHLSNLVFHSVSTVLFYLLALFVLMEFKVERKELIAFFSSLFFAFHPMHVESVSWVAGRTDVLCGLFFFAAFIFYILSYRKLWFLVLSALFFFLSLLSKEVAIAFPLAAFSFDFVSGRYKGRANIVKYAVCGVLVLIYIYLRGRAFIVVPEISDARIGQSFNEGIRIFGVLKVVLNSYLFYIKELVLPFDFNAYIATVPGGGYYSLFSILGVFILFVVSFLSLKKKHGIIAFCILWILITLAPSIVIAVSRIPTTPLAERYLYIPSAGYCLLIAYLIFRVAGRIKPQNVAYLAGIVIIVFYLIFTINRQSVWKNNLALWEDTSKKSPREFLSHLNYGGALNDAGRIDEAIKEFMVALSPEVSTNKRQKARASGNIGVMYGLKGDFSSSEEWLLKSIGYDKTYGRPYFHLGLIYFIRGDRGDSSSYSKAEEYLKKTLRIYPNFGRAYLTLSKLYVRLNNRDKAVKNAKRALRSRLPKSMAEEAEYILEVSK